MRRSRQACLKARESCEWPSGRRRKRTRKEMDEARKLEAALRPDNVQAASDEVGSAGRAVLSGSHSQAGATFYSMGGLTSPQFLARTQATTAQALSGRQASPPRIRPHCCRQCRLTTLSSLLLVIRYRG